MLLEYRDIYAGGRLVGSASPDVITIVNPATEEVVGAVPSAVGVDVDRAVRSARRAFDDGTWATRPPADRADALDRLAAALEARGADVHLTTYAGVAHGSWIPAFDDETLWLWLFSQVRKPRPK